MRFLRDSLRYGFLALYSLRIVAETFKLFGIKRGLSFWLKRKKEVIVVVDGLRFIVHGSSFRLKVSDMLAILECVIHCDYEPAGFEIKKSDTIIDIGSHMGSFSIKAAKKAEQGSVYAFEPSPLNFERLVRNIKENRIKNVKAFQQGVAAVKGSRILYCSKFSPLSNNMYKTHNQGVMVQTTTLDDVFKTAGIRKCNLLKLDCEGAEYEILLNVAAENLEKIEKIACEYHSPLYFGITGRGVNIKEVVKFLRLNGFAVRTRNTTPFTGLLYAKRP